MLAFIVLAMASSSISVDALGVPVQVRNPDVAVWHQAERKDERERGRGMVMLKRDPVKDASGTPIQPALSMIYSTRPPAVTTAEDFADLSLKKMANMPYALIRKETKPGEVVCYLRYNNGMEHRLTIAYRVSGDVAVQFIADTTESVLPQVQADIQTFIDGAGKAFEKPGK